MLPVPWRIDTEHGDALANATQQLEPEIADQLFGCADELLTLAVHLPADKFARHCRDQARRLEQIVDDFSADWLRAVTVSLDQAPDGVAKIDAYVITSISLTDP